MSYRDKFLKNFKILKSKNELLFEEECLTFLPAHLALRRNYLVKQIQQIIIEVVKAISNEEAPSITVRNCRLWSNCEYADYLSLRCDDNVSQEVTNFDSVNSKDKLSKIIYLLSKIHRLLISSSFCSVRELFYQNVNLFQSQSNLMSALRTVCNALNAIPCELGIQTSSKGLIAGPLTVVEPNGGLLNFNKSGGGLIPQDVIKLKNFKSNARFVLVVEKDATFQKLLDERALEKLGPCLIITGKGYPDINTRLMLRRIWEELKLPLLALVDCDPHGIAIMCVYRFGSLTMSQHNKLLAVPALKWLGVHPEDLKELNMKGLQMTSIDLIEAKALRNRPYVASNREILSQIDIMIQSNFKCEIEAFAHISSNYLTDVYIRHKICCMELI